MTKRINVTLTEEEYKDIKLMSGILGITMSAYMCMSAKAVSLSVSSIIDKTKNCTPEELTRWRKALDI